MKVRTRYPALISGRVKRMVSDRLVLCLPEDEFDVRETSTEDAPVALIVTQHETRTEYRLHEGVLYTPLPEMPSYVAEHTEFNPLSALLKQAHPLFGAMAEELSELVRTREANETRPEKLYSLISSSFIPHEAVKRAISNAEDIVETETSSESIALWKAKAEKRLSEIILIDGKQWEKASEPAYKLNLFTRCHVEAHDSDVYENGTRTGRWRDFDWENMHFRYFSALDLDAVEKTISRFNVGRDNLVVNGHIEVILPEALRNDYVDLEFDRAARVCLRKIEGQLAKTARDRSEGLPSFPREPLVAACRLRDALAFRSPFDNVDDSFAAALESFIGTLEKHTELVSEMGFEDEFPVLRDVFDSWCGRDAPHSPEPRPKRARAL
ncbi:hypothetical protein HFO56_33310 [Rhizobium laguerreae]|uniref:hypothetical protein n=1 Tax=Rhizobium laguerreae TaxID=1076926 RepID=UPI001C92959D|nr:hypothetical protein [Rhizobium laguerreae]MBY3157205.1 hypothetical protein [Rhizobium laguerreae]